MSGLQAAVQAILASPDIEEKTTGAARLWTDWQAGALTLTPFLAATEVAGIPPRPPLADPRDMPRRQLSGPENHAALIHALAHIEFNAINLALDAAQRFPGFPVDYYGDWLKVAAEEAYHFQLLRDHLRSLGWDYGDFPAHAGLWELAQKTAHEDQTHRFGGMQGGR